MMAAFVFQRVPFGSLGPIRSAEFVLAISQFSKRALRVAAFFEESPCQGKANGANRHIVCFRELLRSLIQINPLERLIGEVGLNFQEDRMFPVSFHESLDNDTEFLQSRFTKNRVFDCRRVHDVECGFGDA
jgi:hypothetical protein